MCGRMIVQADGALVPSDAIPGMVRRGIVRGRARPKELAPKPPAKSPLPDLFGWPQRSFAASFAIWRNGSAAASGKLADNIQAGSSNGGRTPTRAVISVRLSPRSLNS